MTGLYWMGAVAVFVLLLLWRRPGPSVERLVLRSSRSGDLRPLLAALARKPPAAQPTAFNQAIRILWNRYERKPALELVKELAARHGQAKIAQYWLHQALTTEPAIAREVLSRAFLAEHYRPEVAAQCGPVG